LEPSRSGSTRAQRTTDIRRLLIAIDAKSSEEIHDSQSLEALAGPIDRCRQSELFHRRVELLLLRALAYEQEGDVEQGIEDLQPALTIAAPRQFTRVHKPVAIPDGGDRSAIFAAYPARAAALARLPGDAAASPITVDKSPNRLGLFSPPTGF